jgi:TorA maturation chaperone TorD
LQREWALRAKITSGDFRELALARSGTFGFLASIYLNAPTTELANRLLEGKLTASFKPVALVDEVSVDIKDGFQVLGRFMTNIHDKSVNALAEELAVEWTRLFRGVKRGYGPPPPYESVYGETQRTMGRPATEISNLYAEAGAGLSKTLHELPDYIGVELDSLRFMCAKEADAWNTNRIEESTGMLQLEAKLLKEHLAVWVTKFCDVAFEEAKNDFYRAVLKITKGVVLSEAARIDELIATAEVM